jgi:hypothetical protein
VEAGQSSTEIEKNIDHLLNEGKHKNSRDSVLESLRALQKKSINDNLTITTAQLKDTQWGSIVHAVTFLRDAAVGNCQLTPEYVLEGFKTIHELVAGTDIDPSSYGLLLTRFGNREKPATYYQVFGTSSFYLEDSPLRSYWQSILHRIVAFNMGVLLHSMQQEAYIRAEDRINAADPKDFIQLSSTDIKAKNIPLLECPLSIVHRQEWNKMRQELGENSYKPYDRSGGRRDYPKYIDVDFQKNVKVAMTMWTMVNAFGPVSVFWNALTPSCLYRVRNANIRASVIDQKIWSQLNKQLWGILQVNPFVVFNDLEKTIDAIFKSKGR